MAIIKTKDLTFRYPDSKDNALNKVNIEIEYGEIVLVMGKTGSGKSTLLTLFDKTASHSGDINGDVENNASSTAFVTQNPELSFVSHTVRGELAFVPENLRLDNSEIALKLGEIASFFNITDLLDSKLENLSGGEKATVAVASAVIGNAELLIMDEPFSQLDARASSELIALIKRINQELGVTVIISCHSCEGIVDICDRMIFLDNGNLISDSSPKQAVMNDELLGYFPIYTSLFDERPLSVKEAIPLAHSLSQKEYIQQQEKATALQAKHITFSYGRKERDILSSLDFTLEEGTIHSVIGSNGCGKSTMLKAFAGIKKCYSGKIITKGRVAYMPQDVRYLFSKDTVAQEITPETAHIFSLDSVLDRHPFDLSGGQMQLLALAILDEQDYDILLLDEVARGLDPFAKKELADYLDKLRKNGKSIIVVSHDLDFVSEISDKISFLSDGVIAITGDRRKVLSSLDFYTSSVRRITRKTLDLAVSTEDIV